MGPHYHDSLVPQLQDAERALSRALGQACSVTSPSRANTGELVRCAEALELASDAAKRAITIRRRRRLDEAQRTERVVMADAEAAAVRAAAHRAFTDARRVTWDVFTVYPVVRPAPYPRLPAMYEQGWLCFESAAEKRRLAPIPPGWQSLSDRDLEQLAGRADVVPVRRRRGGPEADDPRPPRT